MSRVRWSLCILSLFLVPVLPAVAGAGLQNSAWPMFHRNAEHGGLSQAPISSSPMIVWSAALTDSAEFSSPAIDIAGHVYIGDVGDRLHKFDPAGNLVWSFDTGGNVRRSSPAIAEDGTIYIGAADGNLYAVNPDGTEKWRYTAGGAVKTAPTVTADGSIYFGSDDGKLYSLDPLGGLRWSYATADTIRSSPAAMTDSLVVFGSNDGGVYALRSDGTLAWSGFTGGPVKASITVGQGDDVFVPSQDGFLYSLRNSGALNWAAFTDQTLRTTACVDVTGRIYVGADEELWCFGDEGEFRWVASLPARILASPIVHSDPNSSDDTAIVGTEDGVLYGVLDGDIVWSVTLGAPIRSSAAIGSDGRIYVGCNDGRLYAIGNDPAGVGSAEPMVELVGFPNPSHGGELVQFRGDDKGRGALSIYDAAGRWLTSVEMRDGRGQWEGRLSDGRPAAPGVYYYRLDESGSVGRIVRVR